MTFNKLILVFYVDVSGIDGSERVMNFVNRVKDNLIMKDVDEQHFVKFFIPVKNDYKGSKIECINAPIFMTGKKAHSLMNKKLEKLEKKLDKLDSIMFPSKRKIIVEKV